MNLIAFEMRLTKTCCSRLASPKMFRSLAVGREFQCHISGIGRRFLRDVRDLDDLVEVGRPKLETDLAGGYAGRIDKVIDELCLRSGALFYRLECVTSRFIIDRAAQKDL